LYCHYCSVMHVTVMPVSAYMALAFVFGFIPNKLMMMMMMNTDSSHVHQTCPCSHRRSRSTTWHQCIACWRTWIDQNRTTSTAALYDTYTIHALHQWRKYETFLKTRTCIGGSLAQCAPSLKRLSAGPGFNPQTRQNKLFHDYWRACFEIHFSDWQDGLTVSSIMCDR